MQVIIGRKIAFFIESMSNSAGMERVLATIANSLVEVFDVSIVTYLQLETQNDYFELSEKAHRGRLTIPQNRDIKTACRIALSQFLCNQHYDVVVSMGGLDSYIIPSIKDGSKKILWYHFSYDIYKVFDGNKGLLSYVKRHLHTLKRNYYARKFDRVIVLCKTDRAKWRRWCRNVEYIYNPLTISVSETAKCENKVAIAVGRLERQKGFDYLIDAWKRVNELYPDWKLNIFGEGGLHRELQEQIDKCGLDSVITLCGVTNDIVSQYLNSSMLICSSRDEAFGLMIVEAEACGLPIVTYACPSAPAELVQDGINGFVVPEVGDVRGMADAINKVLDDEERRISMGNVSKQLSNRYDISNIQKNWIEMLDDM